MDVVGLHIIADLSQCKAIHSYDNEEALSALLLECAAEAETTVLSISTHKFEPQGISALVYLAESHVSVHLWPEAGYVSFDCYTCGHTTDPYKALEFFKCKLKPLYQTVSEVNRGRPHPYVDDAYTHEVAEEGFQATEWCPPGNSPPICFPPK